jgi:AcrR family transcriptional regulator
MLEKVEDIKKQDPRVRRTRQWLHQALLELMREKNFEAITVQDIAERADVNRGTFYAHFVDKYALLEDAMRAGFQQLLRAELPEGTAFSRENLARLIRLVSEQLVNVQGHCPPPRGQMDSLMEKQLKAELSAVLSGWLGQPGAPRRARQPTPEQVATMASWAIYGAAAQWSDSEPRQPVGEFTEQVLPLILAILQPGAG